eukprot:CAMPEP_0183358784 /NCGR_PEP_ID=MMETSP0164_2-20130417/50304_1 /TAXON_ID=221442 /ORGANISM="Coccolithus pelagicus ssp braarudi, Strain PLY182g" /LENGTH=39 /DNA_ID= /DNA_START= /DNA_END= /DNA_ORIENTATION=
MCAPTRSVANKYSARNTPRSKSLKSQHSGGLAATVVSIG